MEVLATRPRDRSLPPLPQKRQSFTPVKRRSVSRRVLYEKRNQSSTPTGLPPKAPASPQLHQHQESKSDVSARYSSDRKRERNRRDNSLSPVSFSLDDPFVLRDISNTLSSLSNIDSTTPATKKNSLLLKEGAEEEEEEEESKLSAFSSFTHERASMEIQGEVSETEHDVEGGDYDEDDDEDVEREIVDLENEENREPRRIRSYRSRAKSEENPYRGRRHLGAEERVENAILLPRPPRSASVSSGKRRNSHMRTHTVADLNPTTATSSSTPDSTSILCSCSHRTSCASSDGSFVVWVCRGPESEAREEESRAYSALCGNRLAMEVFLRELTCNSSVSLQVVTEGMHGCVTLRSESLVVGCSTRQDFLTQMRKYSPTPPPPPRPGSKPSPRTARVSPASAAEKNKLLDKYGKGETEEYEIVMQEVDGKECVLKSTTSKTEANRTVVEEFFAMEQVQQRSDATRVVDTMGQDGFLTLHTVTRSGEVTAQVRSRRRPEL